MNLCDQTWSSFEESFRSAWPSRRDARVFTDGFGDDLVERWREETWLFAAAKMARRIVGLAKAKDIESLPEELREGAARGVLETARAAVRLRVVSSESSLYVSSAMKILRATTTR
jgi:5-methylthioribose kinase